MTQGVTKLVHDYGVVLELTSLAGFSCTSETFLPASKKEVKSALLVSYIANHDNEELREILGANFVLLSGFVPLDDALIVARFETVMKQMAEQIAEKKKVSHPEDWEQLFNKYKGIQARVAQESKELLEMLKKIDNSKKV